MNAVPPRNATDPTRGTLNFTKSSRKTYEPDHVDTSNAPLSIKGSAYTDPTETDIKPLQALPPRNYDLPVQKRPIANKDNPWEDRKGWIVPRQVNPAEEGTAQAFGGTAGAIWAPDPNTLASPPPVDSPSNNQSSVPDSPLDESNRNIAVLNRNTMFSLSDYERVMLMKERDKLQDFSQRANFDLKRMAESRRFYNLSLDDVARNTVMAIVAIFVDILNFFGENEKEKREDMTYSESANRFAMIFLQKERLLYFGVFLVCLSALFMIVFLSS